jgi:hypothetical protein
MAIKTIRIGSASDIFQYDDGDFDSAIETDHTIKTGVAPSANDEVVRYQDLPTLGNILSSGAVIADNKIVRGDGGARAVQDSKASVLDSGAIRFDDSIYWACFKLPIEAFSPGSSGATWTDPDANTLGGYNLDSSTEHLYSAGFICTDWDESSDLELILFFETDQDNSGGNIGDSVEIDLTVYIKGEGDTSTTSQSLSETITIDQAPRYKAYICTFTIDYDDAGAPVSVGDGLTFDLSFDTANSDISDIIANRAIFRYKTKQVKIEV